VPATFSPPKPTTNASESRPWWRRWWVWSAVVFAMIALFVPVLRW
jgi:hypothetical protein